MGDDRQHQPHQFLQVVDGELIAKDLLSTRRGEGKSGNLVEPVLPGPLHAPKVHVRFAFVLVNDSFHRVVVVHPGLPDVIAHGLRQREAGISSKPGKPLGGLRMKPHEDGKPIDRLPPKGGMYTLL